MLIDAITYKGRSGAPVLHCPSRSHRHKHHLPGLLVFFHRSDSRRFTVIIFCLLGLGRVIVSGAVVPKFHQKCPKLVLETFNCHVFFFV